MRISKLLPSQRVHGRWLVYLEDGSILRIGEGDVVSFALCAGMELDENTRSELVAAARLGKIREKALNVLSARPLSRKELIDKLISRPRSGEKEPLATRDEAAAVADRLEELGYLDDAAYACTVAEHYAAKGYGSRRIREELYRRGIAREYWDTAVMDLDPPEEAIDTLIRKKLRGSAPEKRELKRTADALLRRGYCWEEVSAGLRRYAESLEDEFL